MAEELTSADASKLAAALAAVALVEDGMRLGLGTGSTASWMVRAIADRARREGLSVTCVATSTRTARLAAGLGLDVLELDAAGWLDLTIDGADEFDPDLTLIKGGGGAHLQEKIVAAASDRMVVIADAAKAVDRLGAFPLPVEVLAFGLTATRAQVARVLAAHGHAGARVEVRSAGEGDFVTDEGNRLLDLHLGAIDDAAGLAAALLAVPGVVETGLFLGMTDTVIVGHGDGGVETWRPGGTRERGKVDLSRAGALARMEA